MYTGTNSLLDNKLSTSTYVQL